MLPSISQSPASAASVAAGPVPPDVAAGAVAQSKSRTSVKDALAIADHVVDVAKTAGLLPAAGKAAKAKSSGTGYAKSTSKKASASKSTSSKPASKSAAPKKPGPLAFLDDPKLSVEDKLMRLLSYLNDKWDKDLQKKMKDLKAAAGGDKATSSSSAASTKKKSKGLLGSIGSLAKVADVARQFFPGVGVALDVLRSPAARSVLSKVGGPVLAAAASAVGFPQLAPVALQLGPRLVDLAAGVATSIGQEASAAASGAASTAGTTSAASGATDGAGLSSDREAQLKLMEIQRVIDQQREMFSLVSNMLRSRHDTRMALIQNVR